MRDEEHLYVEAGVNALIHMGAVSPESIDKTNGGPYGDIAAPLASTLGFYVTASGGADGAALKSIQEADSVNSYSLNTWGCRDEDYTSSVDLIAAGCSMTFGQGVPVETRWSSVLGKMLGMSVATLAIPGWSTQSAINAVMSYIKKFGKPKVVVLYLPDLFRYDFMASRDGLIPEHGYSRGQNDIPFYLAKGTVLTGNNQPTYSKKPHAVHDVFNAESAHFFAGQALRFFIEYCKEAGIQLMYGTWHIAAHEYIEFVKKADLELSEIDDPYFVAPEVDLSGYVDLDLFYPKNIPTLTKTTEHLETLDCHQELKSQHEACFDWGTDRDKHIGVHAHAHIAEKFLAALKLE